MGERSSGNASPARRWTRISCRAVHVAAMSAVVGGTIFGGSREAMRTSWVALLVSGMFLIATDLYSDKPYLREMRGVALLLKLVAVALMAALDTFNGWALMALIIYSVVFSHMPSRQRHRRVW